MSDKVRFYMYSNTSDECAPQHIYKVWRNVEAFVCGTELGWCIDSRFIEQNKKEEKKDYPLI